MGSRLSLANKCLVIFGAVISIIIVVMLSILWTRTATFIHNYQEELASQLAEEWLDLLIISASFESHDLHPFALSTVFRRHFCGG